MSDAAVHREQIVSLLRLLSSADEQTAYERDVPIARVPAELICMWFNDQYHPHTDTHRSAFMPAERATLADFRARFERVCDAMPAVPATVADLHALAGWKGLMRAAADALASFGEGAA